MIKRMTCRQSSGACKTKFFVEKFAEVVEQSKQNSMGMFQAKGAARIAAMKAMKAFPSMTSGRLLSYESDVVPSWDEGLLKLEREARDG